MHSIKVIIIQNRISDQSSNPGGSCLHFHFLRKGKDTSLLQSSWLNSRAEGVL